MISGVRLSHSSSVLINTLPAQPPTPKLIVPSLTTHTQGLTKGRGGQCRMFCLVNLGHVPTCCQRKLGLSIAQGFPTGAITLLFPLGEVRRLLETHLIFTICQGVFPAFLGEGCYQTATYLTLHRRAPQQSIIQLRTSVAEQLDSPP